MTPTSGATALRHLKKLVSFRTILGEDEGFSEHRECADYIEEALAAAGMQTRRFAFGGRPSVVGFMGRARGRTLVFNGHYDTVPDNQPWDAFKLAAGRRKGARVISGKGTADMKAGIACFLAALSEPEAAKSRTRVVALMVPDEETGARYGTQAALRRCVKEGIVAPEKSFAVVGEPTQFDVVTRRRARYLFRVEIPRERALESVSGMRRAVELGNSIHSAHTSISSFRYGKQDHPLFELSQSYFFGRLMGLQEVRLGGTKAGVDASADNVVPSKGVAYYRPSMLPEEGTHKLMLFVQKLFFPPFHSDFSHYGISICPNRLEREGRRYTLWLDLRIMNNNRKQVASSVRRLARESGIPGADVRLAEFKHSLEQNGRWPMEAAAVAEGVLGRPVPFRREGRGQSDASCFAARGIPVVELGSEGGQWHSQGEFVTLRSLDLLPRIYSSLIAKMPSMRLGR
ncbi:MAG: M20/M25/M40 family metallo-hydrolase [Candidatus Micrarchaeota archaeon]